MNNPGLVDRADQGRQRDLALPDDVAVGKRAGRAPVADVHDEDAVSAPLDRLDDVGVVPDVPGV